MAPLIDRLHHRPHTRQEFELRVIELNRGQLIVYKVDSKSSVRTKYQVQSVDEILYFAVVEKQHILIRGTNDTCMTLGFEHDPSLFPKWLKALEEVTESVSIDGAIEVEDRLYIGTVDDLAHVLLMPHELLVFEEDDSCEKFRNAYLSQNHGKEAYLQLISDTAFCSISMTSQTSVIEENEVSFHVSDGMIRLRFTADSAKQAQNWVSHIDEKRKKSNQAIFENSPDTQSVASVPIRSKRRRPGADNFHHHTTFSQPHEVKRRPDELYWDPKYISGPTPYGPLDSGLPPGGYAHSAGRALSMGRGYTPARYDSHARHVSYDTPASVGGAFGPGLSVPGEDSHRVDHPSKITSGTFRKSHHVGLWDHRDPTYVMPRPQGWVDPGFTTTGHTGPTPQRNIIKINTRHTKRIQDAGESDQIQDAGESDRVIDDRNLYMSDVTSSGGLYVQPGPQTTLEVDAVVLNQISEMQQGETDDRKRKAVDYLSQPKTFRKFTKRGKLHTYDFFYDKESHSITWSGWQHKKILLHDILYIVRGKQTKQFFNSCPDVPEERCFSIVGRSRTLNLMSPEPEAVKEWARSLRILTNKSAKQCYLDAVKDFKL